MTHTLYSVHDEKLKENGVFVSGNDTTSSQASSTLCVLIASSMHLLD